MAGTEAAGGALNAGVTDNTKEKSSKMRDMPILGLNFVQCPDSDKLRAQAVPNKQLFLSKSNPAALPRAHRPIVERALYAGPR
jgi:hypothetical protein